MTGDAPVMIGVAVVEHLGRYLVGWRSPDRTLPGKAEFPGGKCGPHEAPQTTAVRECREEAGLDVVPVTLLMERIFRYEHATVDLRFWLCRVAGDLSHLADGYRWLTPAELMQEDFPEANEPLLEKIRADAPFFKVIEDEH